MAYVPVSRTVTQKFGGVIELRMAVNKAVSGWKVSGRCPRLSGPVLLLPLGPLYPDWAGGSCGLFIGCTVSSLLLKGFL